MLAANISEAGSSLGAPTEQSFVARIGIAQAICTGCCVRRLVLWSETEEPEPKLNISAGAANEQSQR